MIDGETGFLVSERDVEGIANCIRRLHDDPNLRKAMGEAGQAFVRGRYGIQEVTSRMLKEYAEL
jgi:glycosyltransferase involved in cell wall biosynthesis